MAGKKISMLLQIFLPAIFYKLHRPFLSNLRGICDRGTVGRDRAIVNSGSRNKDLRAAAVAAARGAGNLLLDEGQAVGALVDGRVAFMRTE